MREQSFSPCRWVVVLVFCFFSAADVFALEGWFDSRRVEDKIPEGARVTIKADRDEYWIGEKVFADFVVENVGKTPFRVSSGEDRRGANRPLRFNVTATDQNGEEAEDPVPGQLPFYGGFGVECEVKPGEKFAEAFVLLRYVDIKKAGRYTIQVIHDLGWKEEEGQKRPVAEMVLTFRMPGPDEAAEIVAAMVEEKTKERQVGMMVMTDGADFETLRLPVFLKPLLELAEKRDLRALEGIASIPSLEAMEASIRLASESEGTFALEAAKLVLARLPWPAGKPQSRLSWRSHPETWDPVLQPKVGFLARKLLSSKSVEEIRAGARLVQSVGSPEEATAVIAALDRALGESGHVRSLTDDTSKYALGELRDAVQVLNRSGFVPGHSPSGSGAIYAYFDHFMDAKGPRPEHWQKNLETLGRHHSWPVRQAALLSIPNPLPLECTPFVRMGLNDKDKGVCQVACGVAGKSGDKAFIPFLMEIVKTENDEGLWIQACEALRSLGVDYELLEASAERLGDENLCRPAIENLKTVVDAGDANHYIEPELSRGERLELRKQWQRFLAKNEDDLRNGKRFKIGDPALVPELFSPIYQFRPKDGPPWPLEKGL